MKIQSLLNPEPEHYEQMSIFDFIDEEEDEEEQDDWEDWKQEELAYEKAHEEDDD